MQTFVRGVTLSSRSAHGGGGGARVVFVVEESFAGTLEAQGFEERLMGLTPPPETEEAPGRFWKDFIHESPWLNM